MSGQVSEEEKKAIEWFKSDLEMTKELGKKWGFKEDIKNNEIILNLIDNQQKEIEDFKNIKKEHQIMKRIILENGLWETLLKDDEFIKHLNEEN